MARIEQEVRGEADQLPRTLPAAESSPMTPREAFMRGEQRGRALYRQVASHADAEIEAENRLSAPSRWDRGSPSEAMLALARERERTRWLCLFCFLAGTGAGVGGAALVARYAPSSSSTDNRPSFGRTFITALSELFTGKPPRP